MSKDKISDYSSTSAGANLNTDIAGINIDEGCPPSGINNAIRALMSQIKDLQTGVSGDTLPIAAGGTGEASAASARSSLGVAINSDVIGYVAPGTSGNVLTSDGSSWTSAAVGAAFATGTAMMFAQTAAPTGWTKSTTHNDKALRVVSGTASSGGSVAFTTAFASQTPTGSVTITSITGSAGATTLTTPQIPAHSHGAGSLGNTASSPNITPNLRRNNTSAPNTGDTGGGGSHDHPFSFSSGSGTFSGSAINLAVQYVDVIIATKD